MSRPDQAEARAALRAAEQYERRRGKLSRLYGPLKIHGLVVHPAGCIARLIRARAAEIHDPEPVS